MYADGRSTCVQLMTYRIIIADYIFYSNYVSKSERCPQLGSQNGGNGAPRIRAQHNPDCNIDIVAYVHLTLSVSQSYISMAENLHQETFSS